jgi:pimeloyl-ACP methyl ester carboxylesterase
MGQSDDEYNAAIIRKASAHRRLPSVLDGPEILSLVFHPRPESHRPSIPGRDFLIPVEERVMVGARFHPADPSAVNILFFHGNGEIVADYDDMGPIYNRMGINFLPVDYRGYGRSTGNPTISSMMKDCHVILGFFLKWLKENRYTGPLIIMGRSLGSASALELAANHSELISGLIIESGFAHAGALLKRLGIDVLRLGFDEKDSFGHTEKIRAFEKPTLIIHAEWDQIIPFSDARTLFNASPATDKTLLKIPQANHNDILVRGMAQYLSAVKTLADKVKNA